MIFSKKEIGYVAASLNAFKMDMESVGQKETADEIESLLDRILEQPLLPPECQTEEERRAFAFGWYKALETHVHDIDTKQKRVDRIEKLEHIRLEHPLDQIKRQRKDIQELTHACQLLFRRNQELLDELRRSEEARHRMDQRARRKP